MILRFLIHIVFFLAMLCIIVLNTDFGLVIIIHALPGKAHAGKISGSLLQGWRIKNLTYQYDGNSLSIKKFSLKWQWKELLKQNLIIDDIKISDVNFHATGTSNNNEHYNIPHIHLPINIYLNKFLLDNLNFYYSERNYLIKKISLSSNLVNNVLTIKKVSVKTPDLITSGHGKINLSTWQEIYFNHELTLMTYPNLPIITTIMGNEDLLSLQIKSKNWLDANIKLHHYLKEVKDMFIQAHWFVDTTRAGFAELRELNGKLLLSGKINGNLLRPTAAGRIFAQNIKYDTIIVKKLNSHFSITFDNKQKINFMLSGNNISFGKTVFSKIDTSIIGTIKSHIIKLSLEVFNNEYFLFSTHASFDGKNSYYFKQGYCNIVPLNIILSPINFQVHLEPEKALFYQLDIQQLKEKISLKGETKLEFPNFLTLLSIFSNKFTIINTPAYKIIIEPDLKLNYTNSATKIDGTISILDALIAPIDFSNTITLTSDIVYINNQGQPLYKKSAPLQLLMNLMLNIKNLKIDYKGVKAVIDGQTKLTQAPNTELNAFGQLKITQGTYKAYGQALTIQPGGTLNFNRTIDNPQLNIMASKKISVSPAYMTLPSYQPYLIAGVQITGTADDPNIRLFSDPTGVSQQDILSYLVFGYPQNQLTNAQANILWNAFNMMGSGKDDFNLSGLQKSIQNELGFSEFGLGSTSEYNATTGQYESGTAFVVGKRITDNLTATYNVGLLVPVNVLYLRYQLAQNWSLQSDSSSLGIGGDIFYTIRRD